MLTSDNIRLDNMESGERGMQLGMLLGRLLQPGQGMQQRYFSRTTSLTGTAECHRNMTSSSWC